jgi:hypothetical protein
MPGPRFPSTRVPERPGAGRVFADGRCHDVAWEKIRSLPDHEVLVTFPDGRRMPVGEPEKRLGFVYREPDSGSTMTGMMVFLDPGEADPVGVPTDAELTATAFGAMGPIFASVAAQETDPDDIDFCRQIFCSSAAMLRTIQAEGSVEAARTAILRDVFRI